MKYSASYFHVPRYEYVSCNQHGARYKKKPPKKINVVSLSCERTDAVDIEDLIILGHTLNVPVHYDFDENRAYIEIMSAEAVRRE